MEKKAKRYILFVLFFQLTVHFCCAQLPDYHVQLFGETFGIRTDMLKVIKDYSGFVWLMSNDRVHRFDGKYMKDFNVGERVMSIFCDSTNQVWANSTSSIYLYKNDREGFIKIPFDTTGAIAIGRLFQLPGKELWMHTSKGIFEWSKTTKAFKKRNNPELNLQVAVFPNVFSVFNSTIFLATHDSIFAIDAAAHTRVSMACKNNNAMYAVSNRLMLITGRKTISSWYDFDTKKIIPIDAKKEIPGNKDEFLYIRDILALDEHRHLLATHSGLIEVNSLNRRFKLIQLYHKGRPLEPSPFFFSLYLDRSKKIWLMHGSGLISFTPDQETIGLIRNREIEAKKIWLNNVRNFVEDEKGNLWISTSQGFGYWNFINNSITMFSAKEGATDHLNQPSVRGLIYDGHYLIMGTANGGIWMYEPATKKYRRPAYPAGLSGDSVRTKLETEFIQQIFTLPDQRYLIIGRNMYLMNNITYEVNQLSIPGSNESFNYLYSDSQKNIWLCTTKGLYFYDSTIAFKKRIHLEHDVLTICEYKKGTYYAGTIKGLFRINTNEDKPIVTREYFIQPDIRISFIINDPRGKFWIGTDEGLSRYDPITKQTDLFDFADNVQGNVYSRNAIFYNKSGMLFLGGNSGINYFHPAKIEAQKDSLQVIIMKAVVNQDDSSFLSSSSPLSLTYFQNSIEFEFIAPYYGNTNRLQYRYRLVGLDSNWKNNGTSNRTRFTSLNPAHYTFIVSASINGKDWYESSGYFRFTIAPPFWKTWWFITLVIASCLFLAFWLFRHRIMVIKKRAAIEQQLTSLEIRALRSQMNPHFIFNSLNSIAQLFASKRNEEGLQYLNKFSKLLRLVLEESEHSFIALKDEIKILDLYLQLETLRFGSSFSYTIHADEELDEEEVLLPSFLIHPVIENAIWHGLLHKQGERRLIINFHRLNKDQLECVVKDNGIGIEAASQKKEQQMNGEKKQSKGLKMVRERLILLEQQQNSSTDFRIEDMKDDNGYISGTKVTIQLPVINE